MQAVLCPVCNGSGRLLEPNCPGSTCSAFISRDCHGCGGKGWVSISDNVLIYSPQDEEDKREVHIKVGYPETTG